MTQNCGSDQSIKAAKNITESLLSELQLIYLLPCAPNGVSLVNIITFNKVRKAYLGALLIFLMLSQLLPQVLGIKMPLSVFVCTLAGAVFIFSAVLCLKDCHSSIKKSFRMKRGNEL